MHIQDSLTDAHRAAALLAAWDAMMAEVYEYVMMDRERMQRVSELFEFQDVTLKGD